MTNMGLQFALKPINDPSFLEGRAGSILVHGKEIGLIGEIHPQVIENWKLENPVAAMEINLSQLFEMQRQVAGEAPEPPTSERAN